MNIGSIVGAQEGIEAGLVTGGLASGEQRTARAIATGLGATAVGVAIGHKAGESSLTLLDQYVGDGGIGFVPAVAIGSSIVWHNLRANVPQESVRKLGNSLPYLAAAGFAAFEGAESGILMSSVQSGLLTAEAVTLSAAAAVTAVFGGIKSFASKVSPKNALTAARAVALMPAIYLGAQATPDVINEPKAVGVGIAVIGTTAVGGAVASFFKNESKAELPAW